MPDSSNSVHPGRRLRDLMSRGTVMCPGAFNALVARAVTKAGFDAVYISGGATANVSGYPDIGLITLAEMCRTIREIADASGLPVVVDADTGYGEVECVVRTVVEYERAGAAAMHIEDQEFPKRCGHLDDKTLIPASDMAEKISAAAKHRLSKDFVVIARTDARSVTNMQDAIDRANIYRKAGADVIFPEGLESEAEFAAFAKASPGLLLANMTEFGKTPDISAKRFGELGYQIVIYPLSMMRLAMGHVTRGLESLKKHGSVREVLPAMETRKDLYDLLGYQPGVQWEFSQQSKVSESAPSSDAPPTSPLGERAADADALFRVFVQHRDVACPRCDYNIRNAQNPTCPECGEPLRLTVGLERPIIGALLATVAPALGCGVCAIIFFILIVIAPGAPRGIVVCSIIMLAAGLGGVTLILRRRAFMRLSRERQRMCAVISITAHGVLVGILALVLLNG